MEDEESAVERDASRVTSLTPILAARSSAR